MTYDLMRGPFRVLMAALAVVYAVQFAEPVILMAEGYWDGP